MLERLRHFASGHNVRIALLVFIIALSGMNIAATLFYHASGGYGILDLGGGANLLDDRGSYTPARAYMLIAHYGEAGIHHYYGLLIADMFFPPTLGVFALLAIVWGIARIAPQRHWPYLLALLPLAYTVADWTENTGIVIMLLNYPQQWPDVAMYTNIVRGVKSTLANTSILIALVTWLWALWQQRVQVAPKRKSFN